MHCRLYTYVTCICIHVLLCLPANIDLQSGCECWEKWGWWSSFAHGCSWRWVLFPYYRVFHVDLVPHALVAVDLPCLPNVFLLATQFSANVDLLNQKPLKTPLNLVQRKYEPNKDESKKEVAEVQLTCKYVPWPFCSDLLTVPGIPHQPGVL